MQQLVDLVRRRKKAILIAAALAAGGYASYACYRSESFQRRKKQAILVLDGLGKLLQAVSSVADSAALISGDLKDFLEASDDECEVPRSIRQLFKILRCPELQDVLVASTSSVCKEIIINVSSSSDERSHRGKHLVYRDTGPSRALSERSDGWRCDRHENFEVKRAIQGSSSRTRAAAKQEGLPERLLTKLFSESGRGFASAVVGSAVKNLVISLFEEMERKAEAEADSAPETFELEANGIVRTPGRSSGDDGTGAWKPSKLLDLACSSKGRALTAECIQLFVEATVSTYLDKTQDVNMFEEMVEAVTKPIHQVPAKEMIVSVCNGAMETLVRTSYEILHDNAQAVVKFAPRSSDAEEPSTLQQSSSVNMVDKVFKTLTVPTNRDFVLDLAGKVTSEAIRSFIDVVIAISAQYVRRSRQLKAASVGKGIYSDAAARTLVLISVCLAALLHIIANTNIAVS